MKFGNYTEFDKGFYQQSLMGPSAVMIIEELVKRLRLTDHMRILDLGCGTGLTSIFLAKEFGVKVFATDLWLTATENYARIRAFGLEDKIIPIHADAHELPFAGSYFDAIISIDAYYYFGTGGDFLDTRMAPLLAKDGFLAVATPGLQKEFGKHVPGLMKPFWADEVNETFHDLDWWKTLWGRSEKMRIEDTFSLACHKAAWADWLECDNPYAKSDIEMMKAENGQYFDTFAMVARLK
ncbi:MAG: methyltransferase domain-containing protein [Oscillospiraceae bacterium]|jgi:cyclopropane fatty-acyl-phospholipid synthase-like methyltransferase|nr:methyltransferase domain-containing protein [Oscillospiraceae bacterium]